jgi:hypothetical protein
MIYHQLCLLHNERDEASLLDYTPLELVRLDVGLGIERERGSECQTLSTRYERT